MAPWAVPCVLRTWLKSILDQHFQKNTLMFTKLDFATTLNFVREISQKSPGPRIQLSARPDFNAFWKIDVCSKYKYINITAWKPVCYSSTKIDLAPALKFIGNG